MKEKITRFLQKISLNLERKKLLIVIVAILILVILGFAVLYLSKSKTPSFPTSIEKMNDYCDKVQDQDMKVFCNEVGYKLVTLHKQDLLSICDTTQNQDAKNYCYRRAAFETQDLSICDGMEDQSEKEWCYEGVAIAQKDLSICDKIKGQKIKDVCYKYARP